MLFLYPKIAPVDLITSPADKRGCLAQCIQEKIALEASEIVEVLSMKTLNLRSFGLFEGS